MTLQPAVVVCNGRWTASTASLRTESFLGREFLVVPAVLVRSQVLNNNLGATFLPPDVITSEWAEMWNGIPVLVGPHPTERGAPVSGRSPLLWNERGVGWVFRARAEQETGRPLRRLAAEVWLDVARAEAVEGFPAVLAAVRAGEPVELSTGFPTAQTEAAGNFEGEAYEIVMTPLGADHLVISTTFTGACAVADGCGLGVNASTMRATMDPNHSPDGGTATATPPAPKSKLQAVLARAGELLGQRQSQNACGWGEMTARRVAREIEALNLVPPSDQERSNMLRSALQSAFGASDREVVVNDVYSQEGQVVFWLTTSMGPQPAGTEYFRVGYTEGEGGAFTFGTLERVRRMITYEPVGPQLPVAGNTTSTGRTPEREDSSMNDAEKKELVADVTNALQGLIAPLNEKIAAVENTAKAAAEAAVAPVLEQVKALSERVDAATAVVNAEREAERTALVTELSTNSRSAFTAAELEAKPLDELRKLAQLAQVPAATNYAGRGAPRAVATNNSAEGPQFAEPVPYFAQNTKGAAKEEK